MADRIAGAYAGFAVSSTVFGRVAGASGLSAVLENAQLVRGRAAAAEAAARADLAARVAAAADMGGQLTGTTTAIAVAVPGAGAVAAGMQ